MSTPFLSQFPIYFVFKFYNAISSHGISQSSRQAGDNGEFYCSVMEPPRGDVLYMSFIPRGPKFTSFLASDARFFVVFNPANLLMLF